ncbi:MAG: bifunctional 3-demethylubiquinol 3-O-methyltransferase/2-polyprenyl-6-hydroxyphenol methylase [Gammaproteobacteria bacterium RIFCSPLOWO2_02_FULL_38_11]|nr:MAG: bifunctional 3-demethylubiquinol 3-O-methyltransferase/2-polyprenyl-6-hydroxyphenol methylase [Gammaproteobacteria bacterium RIFCSPHIGHO2_02_FULL_38_33]OGT67513.1 MAG: bifunctional 3-demethylubiquinol 3-O-methyltransferase/2-polyprenyl-6-hydroxyphenol methylase [Gammaproteobacteria bacterium RIFCSPLOWO2_02_FULL_38_11]OGT77630.1 MAG: bifunctional 3-demethylubiquinol 3-O-methyltransferase/2-polyprenyl-6-hydroxyphenol methylase [Gammaproteobacteria bacterium RIFCSPLOWO2_12_FULL_38_14]
MNYNDSEIKKFNDLAQTWWDPKGASRPLHIINPCRFEFIKKHTALKGKRILDIGCGGGILAEVLSKNGAEVTGIDMATDVLQIAKEHAHAAELIIDYQETTTEEIAKKYVNYFDIITCMELLEHIPDVDSLMKSCSQLIKPGGSLFFSTLNRTPQSFFFAVLGAEYILNLIPRGTHTYSQFIRPSELQNFAQQHQLSLCNLAGVHYNPLMSQASLSNNLNINYLAHFKK